MTAEDELQARIRAELEAEHEERQERLAEKKQRSRDRRSERASVDQHAREQALRQKMRAQFHKENGYKRYTDSRGKVHWLLPEEYDLRMKARKAREDRKHKYKSYEPPGQHRWLMWVGMVVFAMTIGFVLLRG